MRKKKGGVGVRGWWGISLHPEEGKTVRNCYEKKKATESEKLLLGMAYSGKRAQALKTENQKPDFT